MKHRHSLLASALAAGLALTTAAPAQARILETFSLDFSASGHADRFCGVTGLQPAYTYEQFGRGAIHQRGRDAELYFQGHFTGIKQTFTYEGKTVTRLAPHLLERDLKVTDNSDGTWTLIVMFTGPDRVLDDRGRILAKNDGQVRERWIYDPAVDDIISRETIHGSTGTNDDFCAAVLEYWGL